MVKQIKLAAAYTLIGLVTLVGTFVTLEVIFRFATM